MGVGASNVDARVAASVGGLNAVLPQFQAAVAVPRGGVLFALPALLAVGLLEGSEGLPLPPGYHCSTRSRSVGTEVRRPPSMVLVRKFPLRTASAKKKSISVPFENRTSMFFIIILPWHVS
ncbi:MAG: putative transposase [Candidatus Accumulibacter phosphatis]|jgi:hypothetical protein|uniref:putative transposase n=1 Tax=Candidatus Accumulibacter TaxID=327159 RepID=UPI003356F032